MWAVATGTTVAPAPSTCMSRGADEGGKVKLPNRSVLLASVAVLLTLVVVGVVACDSQSGREDSSRNSVSTTGDEAQRSSSRPVYQRYNLIEENMTYDEVVRIMDGGSPSGTGVVSGTFTWEDGGGVARITLKNGRVTSKTWAGWP